MTKLLKGNVSVSSFSIKKMPENISEIREAIGRFAFKKLDPADVRDESTGWVDAMQCFDSEKFSSLLHDRFLIFAVRTDKYSFSASTLRPYLEEAEYLYKKENNTEYLAAQVRKEIKEGVIRKMKMNSFPKTTVTEVAVDSLSGTVYLFSQSSPIVIKFTDMFEKTFETSLTNISLTDGVKENGLKEKMEPLFGKIWRLQ